MVYSIAVPVSAYILSPEEIYGEPDKGYNDGFSGGGDKVIYKMREVGMKKYIAD